MTESAQFKVLIIIFAYEPHIQFWAVLYNPRFYKLADMSTTALQYSYERNGVTFGF